MELPNGKSAKPIYIFNFSITYEDNKRDFQWNWYRKLLVKKSLKGLIHDLKLEGTLFVIDMDESLVYALFDIFTAESTVEIDGEPCVIVEVDQGPNILHIDSVAKVKFKKSGSPIRALTDCSARSEVQRVVNCLLLADVKRRGKFTTVMQTKQNVGRVFQVGEDVSKQLRYLKDNASLIRLGNFAKGCVGLSTAIHRDPEAGLKLQITEECGCFFGSDELIMELMMLCATNAKFPFNPAKCEECFEHLLNIEMRSEGDKLFFKIKDPLGAQLVDRSFIGNFMMPDGIELAYKNLSCLLSPMGCLLPSKVWLPREMMMSDFMERYLLRCALSPDKQRKIFREKCDDFVKCHNSFLERFGFAIEPCNK